MQKIVKRGLALLLCAVLALGAMSLTPSQAQEYYQAEVNHDMPGLVRQVKPRLHRAKVTTVP